MIKKSLAYVRTVIDIRKYNFIAIRNIKFMTSTLNKFFNIAYVAVVALAVSIGAASAKKTKALLKLRYRQVTSIL